MEIVLGIVVDGIQCGPKVLGLVFLKIEDTRKTHIFFYSK
jgi:hypothetical protein